MYQTIYQRGCGILITKIDVTKSQLQQLVTTPVTLVPAPGPNKIICITNVTLRLTFVTPAYTSTTPLTRIMYEGTTFVPYQIPTAFFTSAVDFTTGPNPPAALSSTGANNASIIDKALVLSKASADMTLGNSPIRVTISYYILDVS